MGFILFLAVVIIGGYFYVTNHRQKVKNAKDRYDIALRGNDKRRALEAGREYYRLVRGEGKLTIYDEQAITNDILTMMERNENNTK